MAKNSTSNESRHGKYAGTRLSLTCSELQKSTWYEEAGRASPSWSQWAAEILDAAVWLGRFLKDIPVGEVLETIASDQELRELLDRKVRRRRRQLLRSAAGA